MRLYIAGPMQGLPLYNFPAFFQCAMTLRQMDYEVENPAEKDMAKGFDPGKTYEEQGFGADHLHGSLLRDYRMVLVCGGIVMLPGWEESRHAPIERALAQSAGLQVYDYNPDARFDHVLTPAGGLGRIRVAFHEIGAAS